MRRFEVPRWSVYSVESPRARDETVLSIHPASRISGMMRMMSKRRERLSHRYSTSSFVARKQFHLLLVPVQCSAIFSNKVSPLLREFTVCMLLFSSQFFALCNLCAISLCGKSYKGMLRGDLEPTLIGCGYCKFVWDLFFYYLFVCLFVFSQAIYAAHFMHVLPHILILCVY